MASNQENVTAMTGQEQLKLARETVADKAALLAEIKTDLRALNGKLRQKNARVLVINEENKHLDDVLKTMMEEMKELVKNKGGDDKDIDRMVLGFRMMEKQKLWEENDTERTTIKGLISEIDQQKLLHVQAGVQIRKDILEIVVMWNNIVEQAAPGADYSLSEVETLLDEATAAMS